ncbi:SpoIIE family protein phosphatase [Luteolibacter pohnpeiensis]|uniref:SpoIIE family protein phosphatase n=1 Tax=Luteolibacter pohnpeiensis TaxID=454153 RepID=A0A934VUD7_9BACT|nr:SpoIIE family protein phosphatase [Luteolibacter pohnpeiensis]MBK1882427.1 SpoIIE family protein phosphatase [Luteolibacter pohnpeiensis]
MNQRELLPNQSDVLRFTFPADGKMVEALRTRFIDTLTNGGIPEEELVHWRLIFNEIIFNAIFHGAQSDPSKSVTVEWALMDGAIMLSAEDPGNGPSDEQLKNPQLPEDPTSESGRGLFILNDFADEIRSWRSNPGFRLEITKKYPGMGRILVMDDEMEKTLEELSSSYESLSFFNRLAENLIESGNLQEFIDGSLNEFLALRPNDRIFLQGSPKIPDNIRASLSNAPWFLDPEEADPALRTLGSLTREIMWENNEDLARQNLDHPGLRSTGSGCVFPILAGDIHFGALVVLRKPGSSTMRFRSLGTLRTLADLCGIACANAYLTTIRDQSQKDLRELEIAVGIQKALLPILPAPPSPKWELSIHQDSSLSIAGDYAIAKLDKDGNLVMAIIDVMGKGVSAALLASIFKTAFTLSVNSGSAAKILETINETLCEQLGNLTMFITCAIARVSKDGKSMEHASAGHCPTFYYDANDVRTFLDPSGPPIGIISDVSYQNDMIELQGGERFVFVTDGCYEWDRKEESQGWHKFVDFIDSQRKRPAQHLWEQLRGHIANYCGPVLEDDCTILTLDMLP